MRRVSVVVQHRDGQARRIRHRANRKLLKTPYDFPIGDDISRLNDLPVLHISA